MDNGTEPIADDELLYRRVPESPGWYDPATHVVNHQAFGPHKTNDASGLSVARAKYKSMEDAARGRPGKSYFVAVLRVGDLRQNDIKVVPRPKPNDPGHSELPDMNSDNRKADATLERQRLLSKKLCLRVEGPFGPFEE